MGDRGNEHRLLVSHRLVCVWFYKHRGYLRRDVTQVKPDTQSIPWIKLFCVSNGNYATYCADVANEVDPYAGKAEIILTELRKVVGMARCFLVGE